MFFQNNFHPLNECVACGSENLFPVLDLGNQPLANSYKTTRSEQQEEFPLAINCCEDCFHVQLTGAVDPELMFKDYAYVSGTSKTMHDHMEWFANWAFELFGILHKRPAKEVFDIGCNDGTQLDKFKPLGIRTFGIDPAENLHKISSLKHNVFCDFFGMEFIKGNVGKYDLVVAQNVFAHNYDPYHFMQALWNVMEESSLAFLQTSQADMIKNNEFDTIYHEHISFYNINSMNELCKRTGFHLVDVVKCPLHGVSYIFVLSKNPRLARPKHIQNLMDMELYLYNKETYDEYSRKVVVNVLNLKTEVDKLRREGRLVIGYGAAAKGMTLLNYAKIDLDFIIDDNKLKQGKFTSGSNVAIKPITALDDIDSQHSVVFIPLAWNFFSEIKSKIKSYRNRENDLFVKYFPHVSVSK